MCRSGRPSAIWRPARRLGHPRTTPSGSWILRATLRGADGTEALEALRSLIEGVALHPSAMVQAWEIELVGAKVELAV